MDIEFGNFRITTDEHQFIVHRKSIVDPTKLPNWEKKKKEGASPDKYEVWTNPTYHGKIEDALEKIAQERIRKSEAKTIEELRSDIRQIYREIRAFLDIRV